jgi:hypothetical protein
MSAARCTALPMCIPVTMRPTRRRLGSASAVSAEHTVRIQRARSASRRTETEMLPAASLACRAARMD